MYLAVVFLPFLSFLLLSFFGFRFGHFGSSVLSLINMLLTLILTFSIFVDVFMLSGFCILEDFVFWIQIWSLFLSFGMLFNYLTVVMLVVVNFVSFFVHLYSISYMAEDPHLTKFLSFLSLFTFFMLILVTSSNYIQMFVGWEGVGICSYLLVNFWYMRTSAAKAGLKAVIVNRVGDFFFFLAILLIFETFRTFDFLQIALLLDLGFLTYNFLDISVSKAHCISFCIFAAAVGKSAQILLHTWLPDAMEGPTPVSALIHAATMVTAGIFVVLRSSILLEITVSVLYLILFFGGLTAFFAATTGLFQNDFKKVIAYSTCSQLGYMFFACGISNYSVAFFHLANHAFFKALLFLGAGVVIHSFLDEQDVRRMGGLYLLLPFVFTCIFIGSLALTSFPFLSGFYSKDFIIETLLVRFNLEGIFVLCLGLIAAFFTSFYSTRVFVLVFLTSVRGSFSQVKALHEPSLFLTLPLFFLSLASIFYGYIFKDFFIGLGTPFFNNTIGYSAYFFASSEFVNFFWKLIPLIVSFGGLFLSYIFFLFEFGRFYVVFRLKYNFFNLGISYLYGFFSKKWFFDLIYNHFIVFYILNTCYHIFFKLLDRGFFELYGPWGLVLIIYRIAGFFLRLQTGFLFHYFLIFGLGLFFFYLISFYIYIYFSFFFFFFEFLLILSVFFLSIDFFVSILFD